MNINLASAHPLDYPSAAHPSRWMNLISTFFDETPAEAVGFLVASAAAKVFFPPLIAPLLGIGISMLVTKLVVKMVDWYDSKLLVNLTKEAFHLNIKYPKLQMISFIFVLALSFVSKPLGLIAASLLGSFSCLILDVEKYKLLDHLEQANRKKHPANS